MGDADEPKTEVRINPYIYHCCKRCARKRRRRYLPQDMLFDIFLRLQARVLHDVMRHVCREWNLMIHHPNFIHRHLQNSTSGILIQKKFSGHDGIYVEMRGCRLEICEFDWGFRNLVWTSCNGLVLALDFLNLHVLYVINPLTKQQRAILPPYFHEIRCIAQFCLAFVERSMEFKVVRACLTQPFYIAVLTIGVDKVWRRIDMKHLSLACRGAFMSSPVVTGAYIHWIGSTFVLTFDVETETILQFPLPQLPYTRRKFLPMGSNLSVVSESIEFFRDVWEMNPKTGKWIKLLSFDLRPLSHKFPDFFPDFSYLIIPFGWLAVREVLFFSTSSTERCCVAYNLKTREIHSIELDDAAELYHFQAHVNTLIWL